MQPDQTRPTPSSTQGLSEYDEWYVAKVQEGIKAAEDGRFAAPEEVAAVFAEFGA